MSITIRNATIADIPELLPLLEQLGYPVSESKLQERFNHFMQNDGYGIVIAALENTIVGLVAWSKSYRLISDFTRFHIEGIVVNKLYRGRGIGKKLMIFVEVIARQSSPSLVDLTSGLRRAKDGSHDFYKSLGYKNDGLMAKLYLRKELL